jgi:cyclase
LLDIKKNFLGKYKVKYSATDLNYSTSDLIRKVYNLGVGEIIIQNISYEGTRKGMDLEIISDLSIDEKLPIVLSGGLNSFAECFHLAKTTNISGVAVGANFIYYGDKKAVLIDYFEKNQIIELFKLRI